MTSPVEFVDALKKSAPYTVIKHDADTGNLSHAYMIISPDSYTMTQLFKLLACAVYCKNDACLDCNDCSKVLHGNHADVKYVNELNKNIKVEDAEALIEDTATVPYESGNKLYFIYSADKMNAAAQNKLLKTLEEPQKFVTILLGVQKESAMLDTVKSRAKKLYLDRFSAEVISGEILKITGNPEVAAIAAECSDGLLGKAKEIAASDDYIKTFDRALYILNNLKKSGDVPAFINEKVLSRDNLPAFLDIISVIFRDMMTEKSNGSLIMSKHRESEIKQLAQEFSERALANIIYLVNEERKKLNANVTTQAVAENLLFGILEVKYKCR